MNVTMVRAFTLARFDSLIPGTLFIRLGGEHVLPGPRPYYKLADQPGAELVKFDDDSAYPLNGDFELDPERYLKSFYHVSYEETVLAGPHISSRPVFAGYLDDRSLEALRLLRFRPKLCLPLAEYYPSSRKLSLKSSRDYDRAHHVLGQLKEHKAIELRQHHICLTLIGLNRVLQLETR